MADDKKPKEEVVQLVYDFKCSSCAMEEKAHYKGKNPPFSRNLSLKYPSYIMKDPFSPPGKGEILVLGSDCTVCGISVCINKECSFFYLKMYCIPCALKLNETFPIEVKSKLLQLKK